MWTDAVSLSTCAMLTDVFNLQQLFRGTSNQVCHIFCYRGAGPGCNSREISDRLVSLKDELEELSRREQELDQHKLWVQQSIRNVTDEVSNTRFVATFLIQFRDFMSLKL